MDAAINPQLRRAARTAIGYVTILALLLLVAVPASGQTTAAVRIVDPLADATVKGEIHWEAEVDGDVKSVDFYIDAQKVWTEYSAPYEYHRSDGYMAFDTKALTDGIHTLRVVANLQGGATPEAAIKVTVANSTAPAPTPTPEPAPAPAPTPTTQPTTQPPGKTIEVAIVDPPANATVRGEIHWEAEVDGKAKTVDFYVDAQKVWTEYDEPYEYHRPDGYMAFDTRTLADGAHTLRVVANQPNGGTDDTAITVTVSNAVAAPPPPPLAPTNTATPTVSGTTTVGQTLSASVGTWTGTTPITYTRVWERCIAGACAAIPGASGPTYTLVSVDVGATLRHTVTATNAAGSVVARSPQSSAVLAATPSAPTPPLNTAPPTTSGTATVGQTLSATAGTWTGSSPMTFTRAWERCVAGSCTMIAGATAATYTLVAADLGTTLRHAVTATNAAGSATARSTQTATVLGNSPTAPVNTVPPTVTGTATVGQVLTSTEGTWAGSTPMAYARTWERCFSGACTPITGATAATYTLMTADIGSTVRHVVTATNIVGHAAAQSSQTSSVQATPTAPANTALPSVSGTPTVGQTLTGTAGTWTGSTPIAYTRAWERCTSSSSCSAISGATAATYTLVTADSGTTVRHVVTATNSVGSAVARSVQTANVQAPAPPTNLGSSIPARIPESTGASYYVDGNAGSDSNPGTLAAPWRSINKALAAVPLSGSIINVRAGTYVGQHQFVDRQGNTANPVTLRPYPGEHVLLTTPSGLGYDGVWIVRSGGLRIRGFEITSPNGNNGVRVEDSHDIEVSGNTIHDTGHMGFQVNGIGTSAPTGSRNIQLWGNEFYDNGGAWISSDSYWIRGDHSVYWGGVANNTDGVDHTAYGGVIANNIFHDQPYGRQLQLGAQVSGLIVTNNTFYRAYQPDDRAGNAIQFYGESNSYAPRNIIVVNNIISFAANHGIYGSYGSTVMSTNLVRNNLAYGNPDGDFLNYYGSTSSMLFQLGTNITGVDPKFVNAGGGNFSLQSTSPAIGRADPAYTPPYDYRGAPRTGAPDLGALEY